MSDWDYLDEIDFNLLYSYADVIKGKGKQIHLTCNNIEKKSDSYDFRDKEFANIRIAIARKRRAYYLIWFIYRYVLNCKTYEEAKPYMNKETLSKYRIESYVRNHIYLGADEDNHPLPNGINISFIKIKLQQIEDIEIILDILYNRYDFFEQFECFIRHTENSRKKRAIEALEYYKNLENIFNDKKK